MARAQTSDRAEIAHLVLAELARERFYVVLFGRCAEANGSLHDMAWQQAILRDTPVNSQIRCQGDAGTYVLCCGHVRWVDRILVATGGWGDVVNFCPPRYTHKGPQSMLDRHSTLSTAAKANSRK